ncbi:hypothetical protein AGMMS49975_18650 [Clostridia bacterium]|nr:hypothetical protein AGMMS49975_18650 [Clostridia bacterium]
MSANKTIFAAKDIDGILANLSSVWDNPDSVNEQIMFHNDTTHKKHSEWLESTVNKIIAKRN